MATTDGEEGGEWEGDDEEEEEDEEDIHIFHFINQMNMKKQQVNLFQ